MVSNNVNNIEERLIFVKNDDIIADERENAQVFNLYFVLQSCS